MFSLNNVFSQGSMMTIHPQSSGLRDVIETVTVMRHMILVMRGEADLDKVSPEAKTVIKVTLHAAAPKHETVFGLSFLQT